MVSLYMEIEMFFFIAELHDEVRPGGGREEERGREPDGG
jgi:hypothetical protein